MSVLELLLYLLSNLLYDLSVAIAVYATYTRARRKGYGPLASVLVVLVASALAIAINSARNPPNSTSYRFFIDFFWIPLLFFAAAAASLVWAMPPRAARAFGPRTARFPFVRTGQALIGLSLLFLAAIIVSWMTARVNFDVVSKAISLTVLLVPVGLYLIRRGRRLETYPSLDEVFAEDSRPPVLYLRSFNQESQFFVIGDPSEYGVYAKSLHGKVSSPGQKIGITFEEYLSDDLSHSIGPFVALGSPEDYIAPEGALRTYAKDTEWSHQLEQLAQRAACIVAEVCTSENLRWEFEHLRREGLQQKLVVVTPHSREGSRLSWAFWDLLWRLKGIRSVSWREFSEELQQLGYHLSFEDPGSGSVIGFDAEGKGVLLTTLADRPEDFVEPIRAWLTSQTVVGRHIPAACAFCGKDFYAAPSRGGSVRARFCRECEDGLTPVERACRRLKFVLAGLGGLILAGLTIFPPPQFWTRRYPTATWVVAIIGAFVIYCAVAPLYERRITQRIVNRYGALAEAGDAIAMCRLGDMYREGRTSLPRDALRAVQWYRKAADAGDPDATFNLSHFYDTGQAALPRDDLRPRGSFSNGVAASNPSSVDVPEREPPKKKVKRSRTPQRAQTRKRKPK